MNKLPIDKQIKILHCLVEGNSLRATSRLVDVSINTVTKVLIEVGRACLDYQNMVLNELPCKRVQIDEIWSFCYAKQKNVLRCKNPPPQAGSVWTWTALCADSKMMVSWMVADRTLESATIFVKDLKSRLTKRVQLSSDGLTSYLEAVKVAFDEDVDYAQLVKKYDSRGHYTGSDIRVIEGSPDHDHISTSFVERQNLTVRMHMRRFTRETNGFSKKIENHMYAIALHFMYYNFAKIHKTLRVTPAMELGLSEHVWSLEEICDLPPTSKSKPRGPYGPREIPNSK